MRNNGFRKFVSVLLACVMIFSLCGITAFADDGKTDETAGEPTAAVEEPAAGAPENEKQPEEKTGEEVKTDDTGKTGEEVKADDTGKTGEEVKTDDTGKTGEEVKTDETGKTGEDVKTDDTGKSGEDVKTDDTGKTGEDVKTDETGKTGEEVKTDDSTKTDETVKAETPAEQPSVEIKGSETNKDNITVNVDAPAGAFPAGTTLKITAIEGIRQNLFNRAMSKIEGAIEDVLDEDDGSDLTDAAAFDITFYGADGSELQPDANYPVSVTFTVADPESSLDAPDQLQVFHMESKNDQNPEAIGEPVVLDESSKNTEAEVQVSATQFSIYVVSGKKAPKTITYNFHDGDKVADTQIVKKGDTLNQPKTPTAPEGKAFKGWFEKDATASFTGFGVQSEIDKSSTVDLYAQFEDAYYVTFKESNTANARTIIVKKYAKDDTIVTSDVELTTLKADEKVTGWVDANEKAVTNVSGDVTLYPVITKGHWITYNTDGGSVIDTAFVASGDNTVAPADPTKAGYKFKGWKLKDERFRFGSTLDNDITLTAAWEAETVKYTVVHWQQNAEDNNYSYVESETEQGVTGGQTNATARSYTGFKTSTAKPITQQTISGDGTTTVNVYYDRNVYTLKFVDVTKIGERTGSPICGLEEHVHNDSCWKWKTVHHQFLWHEWYTQEKEELICTKKAHTHSDACYTYSDGVLKTYSLKYGQSSKTAWNDANKTNPNYLWYTTKDGHTFYTEAPTMPDKDLTVYGRTSTGLSTIYYYEYDPASEKFLDQIHDPFNVRLSNWSFTEEDRIEIPGFTYYSDDIQWDKSGSYIYYVNYTRNSYTIAFQTNGGKLVNKTATIPYQSDITDKAPTGYTVGTTTKAVSGQTYYFAGWYDNEACAGSAFDFTNATMPAKNLILYAKWTTQMFTVTFNANGGSFDNGKTDNQTVQVAYGATVTVPEVTKTGDTLLGWYADGKPFSFTSPISSDLTLTAKWGNSKEHNVSYKANTANATGVVTDSAEYAENATAVVLSNSFVNGDKVFVGWNTKADGNGTAYYPNSLLTIGTADVTLYAQWADKAATTQITYDYNGGTDSKKNTKKTFDQLANNGQVKTLPTDGITKEPLNNQRFQTSIA